MVVSCDPVSEFLYSGFSSLMALDSAGAVARYTLDLLVTDALVPTLDVLVLNVRPDRALQ